jgi:hypothetical protein
MSKRPAPLTFTDTPSIAAARRKASKGKDSGGESTDREMLSARVNGINARQFRAYAKLRGETVQTLLDQAIAEFLEHHRI